MNGVGAMAERLAHTTIICHKHSQHTYVEHISHMRPQHCTCCNSSIKTEPTLYDDPILNYGLSPLIANVAFQACDKHNADTLFQKKLTPQQYIEDVLHMQKQSITPLYCHCTTCGSTFTVLRTTPTTQQTPPKHCIYCSSTTISVQQASTEETAFISLAEHYNLSVATLTYLYNFWTTRPNYKTFNEFMNSDTVTQLKAII